MLDKFAVRYLKWTFPWITEPFPKDQLSDSGLAQGNHDVNIHTVQLHFSIWKQLHKMIIVKKRPIPRCLQIVPAYISYWNKGKVYVDVVSRLLSHIKIPFGKADLILQIVVRFVMILVVNGYITTQYSLLDKTMFTDPVYAYIDIRKRMSDNTTFSDFIASVATDFKIPSYRPIFKDESIINATLCTDVKPGVLFNDFPMKRKLNQTELVSYADKIKQVRKGKVKLYLKPGLPRQVRLSKYYPHKNTLCLNKKGTTCALCGHLLGDKFRSTTTKGCETCQVPLCSSNSSKFANAN